MTLSGDTNYALPEMNIQIEQNEWIPYITLTKVNYPDVYNFVVNGTAELPEI